MKKIFLALAVVATFASCADEDLVENEGQGKTQQMTFVASVDDEASTRTVINSSNQVLWSQYDDLSILSVGNITNSEFTITDQTAGTTKGTFTGSCPTSSTGYFAIYPYNTDNYFQQDLQADGKTLVDNINAVKVCWNGSEQVAQECFESNEANAYKTCYPVGTPMIAYASAPTGENTQSVSMKFKHICAYFKVLVTTKVKSISIKANTESDALTAQDVLVNWNDGAPTVTGTVNRSNQVTLTGENDLAPGYYYIAVLPGTITSGITLTVVSTSVENKDTDDEAVNVGTFTKSSTGTVTLARNNIYDLGTVTIGSSQAIKGKGTMASPYLIEDYYDLQTMYNLVNYDAAGIYRTAYYKQTANITCGDGQYIYAIGSNKYQFRGTYDGDGHTITPHYAEGGLFGRVSPGINGCVIKNLTIKDPTWTATENRTFSGLVECIYGNSDEDPDDQYRNTFVTIENCNVTGGTTTKSVTMNHYGGFVGYCCGNTSITNCVHSLNMNITTARDEAWVGGFIGKIRDWKPEEDIEIGFWHGGRPMTATINQCRNNANITVTSNSTTTNMFIGGFVGQVFGNRGTSNESHPLQTNIYNCINNGALTANSYPGRSDIGGIYGCDYNEDYDHTELKNCINNGAITNTCSSGTCNAGGILGFKYYYPRVSFLLCANTGKLSATYYGAILGYADAATQNLGLKYCYNSYTYIENVQPGCAYLTSTSDGQNGIQTHDDCNVSMTNADIVTTANANLTTLKASYNGYDVLKTWKVNGSGLDLDF